MDAINFILLTLVSPVLWLASIIATMVIFRKKGYGSLWMIVPALLFGPLALFAALIMPIDHEGREQMRKANEEFYKRLAEQQAREAARREASKIIEAPKNNETLSVVSGLALVFGPILTVLFQSSDMGAFFGLSSIAGLVGLVYSNWPKKINTNSL